MTRNIPPPVPSNGKPWPDEDRTLRDVYSQFRSNRGESIEWKSWGTGGSVVVGNIKKYLRYPRAFMCMLKNNHADRTTWGDQLGVFDLNDIGAQRNKDTITVYVTLADGEDCDIVSDPSTQNTGFPYHPAPPQNPLDPQQLSKLTGPTPVPGAPWAWYIPPAIYVSATYSSVDPTKMSALGAPTNQAWLRFTGASCEIRVYRDRKDPVRDGDDDGAPPPPDPGDDGNEAEALLSEELKKCRAQYEKLQAKHRIK